MKKVGVILMVLSSFFFVGCFGELEDLDARTEVKLQNMSSAYVNMYISGEELGYSNELAPGDSRVVEISLSRDRNGYLEDEVITIYVAYQGDEICYQHLKVEHSESGIPYLVVFNGSYLEIDTP